MSKFFRKDSKIKPKFRDSIIKDIYGNPVAQPELKIEQGKLRGTVARDFRGNIYYKFQGIPYAKSPVGELRFKAPEPAEQWDEVFDATKPGDACFQRDLMNKNVIKGSENCLVLNIYTREIPDGIHTNLYPVMVWFHGGYFIFGSGDEELYSPEFLLGESLVVITVNYRLGIFGFLSLEDGALNVPGNAGFKDMILALKWIRKNIYKFCGDPHHVTIFGQGAGGASVHLLFLSPLGNGLFHGVIAQSGCAVNPWVRGTKGREKIAEVLNLEKADDKTILETLMEKTTEELFEMQEKIADSMLPSDMRPFGLVLENPTTKNAFLTEEPLQAMLGGRFNHVPFIIGFTNAEGIGIELFRSMKTAMPPIESFIPWTFKYNLNKFESVDLCDQIKHFYFGEEVPQNCLDKIYNLVSDAMYIFPIFQVIMIQFHKSKAPIYVYHMTVDTHLNFFKKLVLVKEPGASHCDDLGYIFKNFATPDIKPGSEEELAMARILKLWTNFAKFGNPTPLRNDKLLKVVWKAVKKPDVEHIEIGNEIKILWNPLFERMNFWKRVFCESPIGKRTECPFLRMYV